MDLEAAVICVVRSLTEQQKNKGTKYNTDHLTLLLPQIPIPILVTDTLIWIPTDTDTKRRRSIPLRILEIFTDTDTRGYEDIDTRSLHCGQQ